MYTVEDLSKAQRLEMIQLGYNPLQPEDISRYIKRQSPLIENSLALTVAQKDAGNLGSGKVYDQGRWVVTNQAKDMGILREAFGEISEIDKIGGWDAEGSASTTAPKFDRGSAVKDYQPRTINSLRSKTSLLESPNRAQFTQQDAKKILEKGYEAAKVYLNALNENLKAPGYTNRINMLNALLEIEELEKRVPKQLLKYWRQGIINAEKAYVNKVFG